MSRTTLVVCAIAVFLLGSVAVERVQAQGRTAGTVGGTSSTGTSSFGSTGTSSFGSTGTSSFGSSGTSGFGSSSTGTSAFGSSGFGSTGTGSTGFGTSTTGTGLQNGYSGFGQQSGYAAVGQAGTTGQTGQRGLTTTSGLGGRTTNRTGQTGQYGQTTGQNIQNAQPQVPMRLVLAFSSPRPTAAVLTSNIQVKLDAVLAVRNISGAQVAIDPAGVTVLSGTAPTESERQLVEKIVSLQPGVGQIRNEMVVATAAAASKFACLRSS